MRTDHDALRWITNMTEATGKLVRWHLRLSEFDFEVVHWGGVKHEAAEALSRLEKTGMEKSPLEDDIPVLTITEVQPEEENILTGTKFWCSLLVMKVWTL